MSISLEVGTSLFSGNTACLTCFRIVFAAVAVIWLLRGMLEQWSSNMIDRRIEKGILTCLWGSRLRVIPQLLMSPMGWPLIDSRIHDQQSLQQPYVTLSHLSENLKAVETIL